MPILCTLFGHKVIKTEDDTLYCIRCNKERDLYLTDEIRFELSGKYKWRD